MEPRDFQWSGGRVSATASRREVRVRWLGTAGYELVCDGTRLLIDPYITRAPLRQLLFGPIRPDEPAIRRALPSVDGVLVGHSHFDHVMDVPAIAKYSGARVWGSTSTANLLRAHGISEKQIVKCSGGEEFDVGPFRVTIVRTVHSRFGLGGKVPLPGDIPCSCELPLQGRDYRCGQVFGFSIKVDGYTIYHWGSADLVEEEIKENDIDLLLMCIAARHATEQYIPRLLGRLRPRLVMPTHYDNLFRAISKPMTLLPLTRFGQFVDDVHTFDRDITIGTVPLNGSVILDA